MNKKIIKKEIEFEGSKISLETGIFAPQANMSVLGKMGGTVVLATVVSTDPDSDAEFFPLRVDYEEKLYAGGFINSSRFVKREGRPTEEAVITSRLIDHAIRPLFPKDFMNNTQVVATVLSLDDEHSPDILALITVSAALHASDIPFNGPFGTVRVGFLDGKFVANPFRSLQEKGLDLDMVFSAVKGRVLGVEASAGVLDDKTVRKAFDFGLDKVEPLLDFVDDFAKSVGNEKFDYLSFALDGNLVKDVSDYCLDDVKKLVLLRKSDRDDERRDLLENIYAKFEGKYTKSNMKKALESIEKEAVQRIILNDGKRPDKREFDEVRDISISVGILPRTHGSAFFSRGLTQSLTVATLGSASLEQLIQNMYGEETKRYIHHYNAPAFSFGETGGFRGPGRREIGHGALAEKALIPVIPDKKEFPYTIRLVSEILSQQGSSSMAATCASTLALMDAGVPIKSPVAGIAVGLMASEKEDKYVVLTDIADFEDFYGYLDFKMTGTQEGVTAIQMDTKLRGVPIKLFDKIFEASKKARLGILKQMVDEISSPRSQISKFAPKIMSIEIKKDQIGSIIGSGGKTIRKIMEDSGATVDVEEHGDVGLVNIAAKDEESLKKAQEIVEGLTKEVKAGEIYDGEVTKIVDFGAFVEILPGKEGLIHVSELSHTYVANPRDVIDEGSTVRVKVLSVENGKISLSKKALEKADPSQQGGDYRGGRPTGGVDRGRAGIYDKRRPGWSRGGGGKGRRDSARRPARRPY